jgi:uncharacterized membrane protein YfcA
MWLSTLKGEEVHIVSGVRVSTVMDLSWTSALAPWLLTRETALLLVGGFVVGIFSVIIGGGFFISIPLLQFLFPSVSYGAIVGNLKVGSFFRGIGSTITNRKEIDWLGNLLWSVPLVIGTVLGVMVIAHLHQRWMLPAIIAAIALSELAPWLAKRITKGSFQAASLATGAYAGFLGAGIGIILVALFRLKHPAVERIAHVKIQARFIEWLICIVAVIAHYFHGNLILALWLVWSVGSFAGGLAGGVLLEKLGAMSGKMQKSVLRLAYLVAIAGALLPFLNWGRGKG